MKMCLVVVQREMNTMESIVASYIDLDLFCWIHPTNISTNQGKGFWKISEQTLKSIIQNW
jgi:hypothetical protein